MLSTVLFSIQYRLAHKTEKGARMRTFSSHSVTTVAMSSAPCEVASAKEVWNIINVVWKSLCFLGGKEKKYSLLGRTEGLSQDSHVPVRFVIVRIMVQATFRCSGDSPFKQQLSRIGELMSRKGNTISCTLDEISCLSWNKMLGAICFHFYVTYLEEIHLHIAAVSFQMLAFFISM